jgi:hypothetical protein
MYPGCGERTSSGAHRYCSSTSLQERTQLRRNFWHPFVGIGCKRLGNSEEITRCLGAHGLPS